MHRMRMMRSQGKEMLLHGAGGGQFPCRMDYGSTSSRKMNPNL